VRVPGLPIHSPRSVVGRAVSDLGAIARFARSAPRQLERILQLGEEITSIAHRVLEITERLDRRAETIMELGERIETRADGILALGELLGTRAEGIMEVGERLDQRAEALIEIGEQMRNLGERVDARGIEIVDRATVVADTGSELIGVLPALERAVAMATPLEGAIDRFGRLVDRLPGGPPRRRAGPLHAPADRSRNEADIVAEPRAPTAPGRPPRPTGRRAP
jgi:hypothetical protein